MHDRTDHIDAAVLDAELAELVAELDTLAPALAAFADRASRAQSAVRWDERVEDWPAQSRRLHEGLVALVRPLRAAL